MNLLPTIVSTYCVGIGVFNLHLSVDIILNQIVNQLQFYQTTVFTLEDIQICSIQEKALQSIISHKPTVLINLSDMFITNNAISNLNLPTLKNPRSSALYIILLNENYKNLLQSRIVQSLDLIAELSPVQVRPKCLLLLLSDTTSSIKLNWTRILIHAWDQKFLDFTILQLNAKYSTVINFNPFNKKVNFEDVTSNTAIFPDKLSNMNNYSLTFPLFNFPPFIIVYKTKNEEISSIEGFAFSFLEVFSQKMNFSLQGLQTKVYLDIPEDVPYDYYFEKLKNNEINLLPNLFLSSTLQNINFLKGVPFMTSYFQIHMPVLYKANFNLSLEVITYFVVFDSIIFFFWMVTRFLQLSQNIWDTLRIFQLLLNQGSPEKSQACKDRIIYLLLILLSTKYTTEIFSILTDQELKYSQVFFDTWQEVEESGLPVYAQESAMQLLHDRNDIKSSMKSKIKMETIERCVNRLTAGQKVICVSGYYSTMYYISQHVEENKSSLIRHSSLRLGEEFIAFLYEKACPYIEKFDYITLKIVEHGLSLSWHFRKNYWKNHKILAQPSENTKFISKIYLINIMSIGYVISLIAFIVECSVNLYRKKK